MADNEKLKITVAAKALQVSRRTIYNYIEKGDLKKIEEDGKTFVSGASVRELLEKKKTNCTKTVKENESIVQLSLKEYDALRDRLFVLENQSRKLIEYKEGKDNEEAETKIKIYNLEKEKYELQDKVDAFNKLGFWRRVFLPKELKIKKE